MPKDTFLNLPEEKRRLIESAAIDEFAEHGFDNASINRIVVGANIAKGSFYQYFADKADLFKHIMDRIGELKVAYITPVMMNPSEHDFFTLLEELYYSGLAFGKENPKAAKIGFEIYRNQSHPLFKESYQQAKGMGFAFYESLLDLAISRGEVEPSIDKPFVIHMMTHMQVASFDYYFENIMPEDGDPTKFNDDVMPTVKLMLDFIKNGIQLQKKGVLQR